MELSNNLATLKCTTLAEKWIYDSSKSNSNLQMHIAVSRRGSLARGANERDGGSVLSAVLCAASDLQCW